MRKHRHSSRRRLALALTAVGSSLFLSLALLEIALRGWAPQPLGLAYVTPERLALHIPNARIHYVRREFAHTVAINSRGLRDREYPENPPSGAFRILALGDSYTEARQVPLEEAYTERIETSLGERHPARTWEVLNAGVSGYGTSHELKFFRHYGRALEPDLVTLAFTTSNDLLDNQEAPYFRLDDGTLREVPLPPLGFLETIEARLKEFAASHFHLYQFLRDRYHDIRRRWGRRTAGLEDHRNELVRPPTASSAIDQQWQLTEALLDQLIRDVHAAGASFLLVAVPSRFQVEATEGDEASRTARPHRHLEDFATERGVPFVDLLPALREAHGKKRAYYRIDGHWNARGHAVAAREILDALVRFDLLPDTTRTR